MNKINKIIVCDCELAEVCSADALPRTVAIPPNTHTLDRWDVSRSHSRRLRCLYYWRPIWLLHCVCRI